MFVSEVPMIASLLIAVHLFAAADGWQRVAPGAETLTIEEQGLAADLIRLDLQRFRPEVVVLGPERVNTAAAVRRDLSAAAVINGGFFDVDRRSLGLRIANGKTVVRLRRGVDWGVLVLRPGRAEVVHSRDFKPDARIEGAIQVGPRLLAGGRPLRLKPQVARRTAVALDGEGRTLTLLVTRAPAEAGRLALLLQRLGFSSALLLDGGASTQISAAIGSFSLDVAGAYGVPDVLVVRMR
jgi:exopolysaccharide biosynthesis protein